MIRAPSSLSALAASNLAAARKIATASTDWTTLEALDSAVALAKQARKLLLEWEREARAAGATERARLREEAVARATDRRRNEEIRQRRRTA